jgi:lipopolysaccharide export LptBFGC system permease protein LptF
MKVLVGVALMGVGALLMGSAVFVVLVFGGLGTPGSIAVTIASMLPGAIATASGLALILRESGSPPGSSMSG